MLLTSNINYPEASYFEGYHFAHIAAYENHLFRSQREKRLKQLRYEAAVQYGRRSHRR